jgi:hypothetical protein
MLSMALPFSKTFRTFTDLLEHPFKLRDELAQYPRAHCISKAVSAISM